MARKTPIICTDVKSEIWGVVPILVQGVCDFCRKATRDFKITGGQRGRKLICAECIQMDKDMTKKEEELDGKGA